MAAASRQIDVRPHLWHVQQDGTGRPVLLLHGAGGATQSWRGVFPILARGAQVVAVDLPGQGFSQIGMRARLTLPALADDLWRLMDALAVAPAAIVGHSAGAALALQMVRARPGARVVAVNAALERFAGAAGWLFPLMARGLSLNPAVPVLFARLARGAAPRILDGTGSTVGPEGEALYARLLADPGHVDATLAMMAGWDPGGLRTALGHIGAPTLFLAGERDRTVPPRVSYDAAAAMPAGAVRTLTGLGHLAHEEAPELVARAILDWIAA